jgi:hypothetical protein
MARFHFRQGRRRAVVRLRPGQSYLEGAAIRHRVASVDRQVHQDLLNTRGVGVDHQVVGAVVKRELDVFWQGVLQQRSLPQGSVPEADSAQQDSEFYDGDYLRPVAAHSGAISDTVLDGLVDNYRVSRAGLSRSERLLRYIWRLSRAPLVSRCVALIPFGLKQSFKRRLSSRPMHDIVHKE